MYICALRIFKLIPPPSSTLSMSSAMFIMLSAKAIVASWLWWLGMRIIVHRHIIHLFGDLRPLEKP